MNESRAIVVTVNGRRHEAKVPVRMTLADFLRHQLGLTGTHVGCEHGVCGACTVLFDGRAARSCLMLAVQADGHEVTTIEGIAAGRGPASAAAGLPRSSRPAMRLLHARNVDHADRVPARTIPNPTEDEVRVAISGNLCRCTGYQGIVAAALDAADRLRSRKEPSK